MSGVYNRKLFQRPSARDQLRQAGGIMSSSSDLIMEALRSMSKQPQDSSQGSSGPAPAMPQSAPPSPPMMGQPPMMGGQPPMMGGQPPMMGGQYPMDPMMGGQYPMDPMMGGQPPMDPMMGGQPPMDPMMGGQPPMMGQAPTMGQSPMPQPIGYEDGGPVLATGFSMLNTPASLPSLVLEKFLKSPKAVDVTAPAGTVRDPSGPANSSPAEAIAADIVAKAEDLASKVDTTAPEDIGKEIVNTAASKGIEPSGDLKFDLASIYERMTGDSSGYESNIDELNRGIIGAAIGAGTSARATENISQGLLVGLQAAKATEERRAGDEQAINAALLGASLKPGSGGTQARDYRSPTDAYQDAYQSVMGMSEYDLPTDANGAPVDRKAYATEQAQRIVLESYTPEQLRGTPFEGLSASPDAAPNAGTTAAPANSAIDEAAVLEAARSAIAAGASADSVQERLLTMGIDPGKL